MKSSTMEMKRRQMVTLLESHLPDERVVPSPLKGVNLFRIDNSFPRMPKSYDPQIIIMAQGLKRLFLGDETLCGGFSLSIDLE
jgi:hypothetical protein